jgi:hypothetical protein
VKFRILAVALIWLNAFAIAGCSDSSDAPQPLPPEPNHPQIVTDLNAISPDTSESFQSKTSLASESLLANAKDTTAEHIFEDTPGLRRQVGSDREPGYETLLNAKAAQYANFSQTLMERLYQQLNPIERSYEFQQLKIPTEIKPTILTAILDRHGNLQELIVEQHSGKAILDQTVIKACKRALWYPNPPVGAMTDSGDYRLTVQVRFENFGSTKDSVTFKTDISLGIA